MINPLVFKKPVHDVTYMMTSHLRRLASVATPAAMKDLKSKRNSVAGWYYGNKEITGTAFRGWKFRYTWRCYGIVDPQTGVVLKRSPPQEVLQMDSTPRRQRLSIKSDARKQNLSSEKCTKQWKEVLWSDGGNGDGKISDDMKDGERRTHQRGGSHGKIRECHTSCLHNIHYLVWIMVGCATASKRFRILFKVNSSQEKLEKRFQKM
jgi:hypothetical protein